MPQEEMPLVLSLGYRYVRFNRVVGLNLRKRRTGAREASRHRARRARPSCNGGWSRANPQDPG